MSTELPALLERAVEELGGSPREGQQQMAEAVGSALEKGVHLLVQAGTGTGKSLAYLVPAVRHAVTTGETVVVSTATLALQSQIVARDLPRLARSLAPELGRKPVAAVLKGRRNYVCLHKLNGGYPEEGDSTGLLFDLGADAVPASRDGAGGTSAGASQLGEEIMRVRSWARTTETGDRDDLVPGVSPRAWAQVSVNAFDCLGAQRCPVAQECFAERAKAKAAAADVVVTNHALLAIDAFGDSTVLPEHSAVIVDEAHELQDRVTSALAGQLGEGMVRAAASSARRHTAVSTLALEKAAEQLAAALSMMEPGLLARGAPEELAIALAAVRDAARQALADSGGSSKEQDKEIAAGRQVARARLNEVFELAERMAVPTENDVLFISRHERAEPENRVNIAPLSVAGTMRSGLFTDRTVVATSATLTLGGSFAPVAGALGLAGEDAPRWDSVDVGSPFDYGRQGILYVARHLPRPGRAQLAEETLEEMATLIEASEGGALGLFSSRRAAEEAATAMRARLDVPILLQGEDVLPTMVKRFAASRSACLFGTLSLWQGVDVPGHACRLVLIDRIPFPRPDDPLASARTRAAARRGANGFMAVSASHAAIRLAQGAGRLIRTVDDRGVVAVLDPRLATAGYGGFLMRSLPPMWATADPEVARGALRRLATPGPGAVDGTGEENDERDQHVADGAAG
ncbi:ATP-dependent DNA helicase [Sediminivirga luteola]|uniref:DNA 5'-3' helicase n=1 Tax=Sediminivirga luteola TaxID=1774748 RepID=A0A8J2TXC6_9MICO|nr:ATP-dependent DNA helicase [Sediminivirga luteola]GGA11751.1 ATP-dependent helicase [Sediminivirga luteola]